MCVPQIRKIKRNKGNIFINACDETKKAFYNKQKKKKNGMVYVGGFLDKAIIIFVSAVNPFRSHLSKR